MKLLLWTQHFWPESFHINEVANALCESATEVTVLTGKPNYPDGKIFEGYKAHYVSREEFSGAEVVRIPLIPRGNSSFIRLVLNYCSFILSGYFFAPFALRNRKFDAVFVYATSPLLQALPAIFIAWLKNAPLIIWVQDLWPESLSSTGFVKNKYLLNFVKIFVRYIYNASDIILIQSEAFRPSVEQLVKDKRKIVFYPNSTNDMEYNSANGEKCEIAEEIKKHFSVVFAGNIGLAQSCETIVKAAELLQDYSEIKFFIIGSGSSDAAIAAAIKAKNLSNIVMKGRLPPKQMPAIFASSSALLILLKDDPAFSATVPSKLQSYLSAGKPIIASLNGEAARIIADSKAGFSTPAEDAKSLADSVVKLYKMKAKERVRLGENGRQYFKSHFDLQSSVKKLIDLINGLK